MVYTGEIIMMRAYHHCKLLIIKNTITFYENHTMFVTTIISISES